MVHAITSVRRTAAREFGVVAAPYVGGIALAATATALQLGAERFLEFRSPFILFYPAALSASLYWGWRAGAICVSLSVVLVAVFVMDPRGMLDLGEPVQNTEIVLFGLVGAVLVALAESERRARAVLGRHREELEHKVEARTRELRESHERLRVSERMAAVGTMAAGLAHDLSNLNLPMRQDLATIQRASSIEEAREAAGRLERCVDYLRSLSRGLWLFTRDAGESAAGETTDLHGWWSEAAPFFRNVLPRGVRLDGALPRTTPAVAMAPHAVTQAVINLVGNAGAAIGREGRGRVEVRAEAREHGGRRWVLLTVEDDGPGMTPEVRLRCLERFFTTRSAAGGTGLGLHLVDELTRRAGGVVRVQSELGRGTAVTLELPAAENGDSGRAQCGLSTG